jgi:Na+-translocating ferredoxin:NAD+ oxidoreductase RnfA subunit
MQPNPPSAETDIVRKAIMTRQSSYSSYSASAPIVGSASGAQRTDGRNTSSERMTTTSVSSWCLQKWKCIAITLALLLALLAFFVVIATSVMLHLVTDIDVRTQHIEEIVGALNASLYRQA